LKKKRIFIVGDSTACIYPHCGDGNRFPRTGWGQVADRFLPEYTIINLALSGRSSGSFKKEENYKYLCEALSPGDYMIIQFGHNDSNIKSPDVYVAPDGDFQREIMEFAKLASRKGAAAILATPISKNRAADPVLEVYVNAVRKLAEDQALPIIDFYEATNSYINRVGCAASAAMFMNVSRRDMRFIDDLRYEGSEFYDTFTQDNTHLNINGALFIAEFAAGMIHEILS
jgi:lysophospholipase L1-like esterase